MKNTELFNFLFSDNTRLNYPSLGEDKVFVTRKNYFFEGKPVNSNDWKNTKNKFFISSSTNQLSLKGSAIQPKIINSENYSIDSSNKVYSNISFNNIKIKLQEINEILYINGKNLLYKNRSDSDLNELDTYISYSQKDGTGGPLVYNKILVNGAGDNLPTINEGPLNITGSISLNSLDIKGDVNLNGSLELSSINNIYCGIQIKPAGISSRNIIDDSYIKINKFDFVLNNYSNSEFNYFANYYEPEYNELILRDNLPNTKKFQSVHLYNLNYDGDLFSNLNITANDIILGLDANSIIYKLSYENGAYIIHSNFTNELAVFPEDNDIPGKLIKHTDTVEFHEVDAERNPNNCFKFKREGNIVHIYGNELIEED